MKDILWDEENDNFDFADEEDELENGEMEFVFDLEDDSKVLSAIEKIESDFDKKILKELSLGDDQELAMLYTTVCCRYISEQEKKQAIYGVKKQIRNNRIKYLVGYKKFKSAEEIKANQYLTEEEKENYYKMYSYSLINAIVVQYAPNPSFKCGYDYEDVYAAALVGFSKALNAYNRKDVSVTFKTYCNRAMKNEIIDMIRAKDKFANSSVSFEYFSTDSDGESTSADEMIDNSESTMEEDLSKDLDMKTIVTKLLGSLTEKEQYLISDYYGLGTNVAMTRLELAQKYRLSASQTKEKLKHALAKLRNGAARLNIDINDLLG